MEESDCTDSDSDDSTVSSSENKDLSSKKPIVAVERVLKNLFSGDIPGMGDQSKKGTNTKERDFFCIEDTLLTKDLKVYVEGMGELSFPLEKVSVEEMIKLSSKAKFGKGKETLLDTKVRDTQTIPASKLKIEINSSSLDDMLKRIGIGLNISKNSQLSLHLHNLLIYGPGQFFKKHTDSEKVQNMIATFVIILPYPHEGGELIIEHNKKKHMFFGSKNVDIAKCVAFYSDCAHKIKKVTDGYRVAITYNVVLQPPDVLDEDEISESLDIAVDNYFKSGERKLAFGLNHSYSQKSLQWNLLKGADRPSVNALLAVAKKQKRIPCLALTSYHEVYDKENTYYCPWESPALVVEETTVNFMINENNIELTRSTFEDSYICNYKEFCCLKKAKELFKPYETDASGPTGNEGDTEEYWYRRACLVLWSNKWAFTHGFKEALCQLHNLTKEDGMQTALIEKLNEAKKDFVQPKIWAEPSIADMLLDIVIYLNNEEEAKFILGDLCKHILKEDRISRLIQLEKMFSDQTWCDIVKIWKDKGYPGGWNSAVENAHTIVDQYLELVVPQYKSVVVDAILEEGVNKFIESEERRRVSKYVYDRKRKECIETLAMYIKICSLTGKKSLEESVINHIVRSSYPAVSLGELYTKLIDVLKPENLISLEIIRDLAEKGIDARLNDLKENTGWAFPVQVTCQCKICSQMLMFFTSKTLKSQAIEASKKTYDHLCNLFYDELNMYSLPCKMLTERVGKKHKITFEKLPQLLEDRKVLNDDLVKFKEKMGDVKWGMFADVKVENENEEDFDADSLLDFSSIEITENMKTEFQDGIDVEPFPSLEEVNIKSEVTEDVENKCEAEIPKKRQRRIKK